MEKACPLCGSKNWNYDIIVSLSGIVFCGDCWHEVKQEAYKIGWNLFTNGMMPKRIYNKALKIAKILYNPMPRILK
jgi:nitrate reductase beta subunit